MKTELSVNVYARTDTGRVRQHNEDFLAYYAPPAPEERASHGALYVVADGIGGGAAGEIASRYAVQKVLYAYYHSEPQDPGERLRAAFRAANADTFEYVAAHPESSQMGTTLVAAVVRGEELVIANVGDSRAYLVRGGEMRQVTQDHTLVARLVAEGEITSQQAKRHPQRNVLIRSIGQDVEVKVDIFDGAAGQGDKLLLCTDGLARHVSDDEISRIVRELEPEKAVRRLIERANALGGRDNISVLLLAIGEEQEQKAADQLMVPPTSPDWQSIYDTRSAIATREPRQQWRDVAADAVWPARMHARQLLNRLRARLTKPREEPAADESSFAIPMENGDGETVEH